MTISSWASLFYRPLAKLDPKAWSDVGRRNLDHDDAVLLDIAIVLPEPCAGRAREARYAAEFFR
jgi:hypothetical protein